MPHAIMCERSGIIFELLYCPLILVKARPYPLLKLLIRAPAQKAFAWYERSILQARSTIPS